VVSSGVVCLDRASEAYKVMFCTEEIVCNLGSGFVDGRLTVKCLLQVAGVFHFKVEV